MVKRVTKNEFADEVVLYAIDHANVEVEDPTRRAKLYRKAGLELVAIAAQMEAENAYEDPGWTQQI